MVNEEKVKSLINKANFELEAHNFVKSKSICYQALELEPDNPNIYLILLLGEHKVTEIEDLQNCKFDYTSENYKNIRRYAGKELNNELDKYLAKKDNFVKTNSFENNSNFLEILKIKSINLGTKVFEIFQNNQEKTPGTIGINKDYRLTKKNLLILFKELPSIIKDFYLGKKDYSDDSNFFDIFDLEKYTNRRLNSKEFIKQRKEDIYFVFGDSTSKDTLSSLSSYIYIFLLALQLMIMLISLFPLFSDGKYIALICALISDILFVLIIKKNYLRIILFHREEKHSIGFYIIKSVISFLLTVIFLITNYFVYAYALKYLFSKFCIIGLFLGIIGSLVVNYLFIQLYSFLRNINILFKEIKNYFAKKK